jgi:hypothetical protein
MPVIHEWHRNSHKTQGAMALAMSMKGLTCEYSWCSSSPFSTTTGVSQLSKVMLPSVVGEPSILKNSPPHVLHAGLRTGPVMTAFGKHLPASVPLV